MNETTNNTIHPPSAELLAVLGPLCSEDPTRRNIGTPFEAVVWGERWAAATNGHALAAIRYDGPPLRKDGPDAAFVIGPKRPGQFRVDSEDLAAWVGSPPPLAPPTPPPACERCKGKGFVQFYEEVFGRHGTPRETLYVECRDCVKKGEEREETPDEFGRIGPAFVNRWLVRKSVGPLAGARSIEVIHGDKLDPILFLGGDRLVAVMPMNADYAEQHGGATAPRLGPPPAPVNRSDARWACAGCGHEHEGARLANICIGCPCLRTGPVAPPLIPSPEARP